MSKLYGGLVTALIVAAVAVVAMPASADDPPPQTSQAVNEVAKSVAYSDLVLAENGIALPHEYVVAQAAMTYTVGHVSAPAYGYQNEIAHGPLPVGSTSAEVAERTLEVEAGICGNAANVMLTILSNLGVTGRLVNVYYSTPKAPANGHSTVEVWYQGEWHWFDPTWATVYVQPHTPRYRVLSVVDVLKLAPEQRVAARVGNDTLLWRQVVAAAGPGAWAETGMVFAGFEHLHVEVDGQTIYSQ